MSRLLALLVIPLTAGALLGACEDREITPPVPGAREIEVTASACRFEPDQIRVDASEDIAIVLTSTDVSHDFTVDDLDVYVEVTGSARHDYPRRRREPRSLAQRHRPPAVGPGRHRLIRLHHEVRRRGNRRPRSSGRPSSLRVSR